jgi:hypothetical protein
MKYFKKPNTRKAKNLERMAQVKTYKEKLKAVHKLVSFQTRG